MSGRQWRARHVFAPIYSVIIYCIAAFLFLPEYMQSNSPADSSPKNGSTFQKQEKYDPTVFCRAAGNCDASSPSLSNEREKHAAKVDVQQHQPAIPKSQAKQQSHLSTTLKTLNDIELCKLAVIKDRTEWENSDHLKKYVHEAIARNLSIQKCFSLNGWDQGIRRSPAAEERQRNTNNQNQQKYDPTVFCRAAETCDPVSKIIETFGSSLIGVAKKTLEMRTSNPNGEDEIIYEYPE